MRFATKKLKNLKTKKLKNILIYRISFGNLQNIYNIIELNRT